MRLHVDMVYRVNTIIAFFGTYEVPKVLVDRLYVGIPWYDDYRYEDDVAVLIDVVLWK